MTLNCDMFSLLPDYLLFVILSLLPFKDAIRTSVLSKRWYNIINSLTSLELNEVIFVKPDEPDEVKKAHRRAFLDFASLWIDQCQEVAAMKFSLKLSMPANEGEFVGRCMSFATGHRVKELELDFTDTDFSEDDFDFDDDYLASFELPESVNTIDCLEYLKLYSCGFLENGLHNFHALKEVSFSWMEVTIHAIRALLSNCKMLESLSMKKCWNEDGFSVGEEEVRLRKLVLDKCHFHFELFKVIAPRMTFFKYYGKMSRFIVQVSSFIEEVELDFSPEYEFEGHGHVLYNLVENLSYVRVLTVCSYLLQVIPSGREKLRIQRDLQVRHLILKSALHENELFGIAFMFNSCPMLERLTIELGLIKFLLQYVTPFENVSHKTFWSNTVSHYRCLRSSLKEVEVKGFKGHKNEIAVLSHLIVYGKVLIKMTINMVKIDDEEDGLMQSYYYEVAQKLLTVPKASNDLEIIII